MCFGDFWDFRIFTSVHWSKPQGQMLWHNISRMLLSSALQHIWYCRSSHGLNILLEIEKSRFTFFFFFCMDYAKEPNLKLRWGFLRESTAGWEGVIPPSLHRTNSSCQAAGSSHWECTPVSTSIFDSGSAQALLPWPRPWHTSKRLWATSVPSVQGTFQLLLLPKQQNQEFPQYSWAMRVFSGSSPRTLLSSALCPVHARRIWEAQLPGHEHIPQHRQAPRPWWWKLTRTAASWDSFPH